jgi:hypothetical protein
MLRRILLRVLTSLPLGLLLLGLITGSAACNEADPNWRPASAPLASPTALAERPQEIEQLSVEITDGRFNAERYDLDPGAIRLRVTTHGGPYTLTIDPILDPHPLPGDQTVSVDFTVPGPAQYIMRLSGGGAGTAVLNVRPPGA